MPLYRSVNLKLQYTTSNDQYITLSPELWDAIAPSELNGRDFFSVSIKIPFLSVREPVSCQLYDDESSTTDAKPLLQSFLAHAKKAQDYKENTELVFVSAHLISSVYGPDALVRLDEEANDDQTEDGKGSCLIEIKPVELVELDELIVGALDGPSFQFAQKDQFALGKLFASDTTGNPPFIIRSGGRCNFGGDGDEHQVLAFRILMTGPVQQGYILSSERTKILAVDMSTTPTSPALEPDNCVNHLSLPITFGALEAHQKPNVVEPQEFGVRILQQPWPESRLFPLPRDTDDGENRIFVGVKDLARCGVFSGDWILACGGDNKKSRLCRVYGVDAIDAINEKGEGSFAYMPPVLYYNLGLPLPPSSIEEATLLLTRLTTPPPEAGPPFASEVSIARIASAASMDKALQGPMLDALKQWFEERERILCNGDVIAVAINEESSRLRARDDDGESTRQKDLQPTTIVYFKVTCLKEEMEEGRSPANGVHPAYYGSGRRIVPSRTKMIQTGIEHARAPIGAISHYYNFSIKLPFYRSKTTAYSQIFDLVSSSLHPLGRDFQLSCNALIHGPRGGGKATLIREIVEDLGVHLYEFSAYDVVSETDAKTEVHIRSKFDKAAALTPCVVLIRNIEGLARKSAVVESGQEPLLATVLQDCIDNVNAAHTTTGFPVMVIATTSDLDALPTSILGCFRHEVVVEAPDEKTRLRILRNLVQNSPIAPDVSLSNLATQTAALVGKDLADLVARAGVLALQRISRSVGRGKEGEENVVDIDAIQAAGITLTASDFESALSEARASYSDSIGAPKIPSVTWDDVGGMANVKDDILDTIQLPLEHPELFGAGLKKRSGILLYGPPGTGKTLLAKAIATSCSLNFFSVKGPELLNMYIGESEANVRRVFQRARDAKPCVVFFDELDSVAPKRGEKGDSGGVMDRIVSQLLAELDGMSEGGEGSGVGDVFVIGATNRPDLLDPALLRPGRFDKLLYLGVSDTHEAQLRIIQALTRKFRLHPNLDLMRVAERCPFHYTGADFYALCSDAMLKAMTRVADSIEEKVKQLNKEKRPDLPSPVTAQYYLSRLTTPEEIMVQVEEIDFINALNELVPSVSATELAHYQSVRAKFEQIRDDEEEKEQQDEDLRKREEEEEARRHQEQRRKAKGKGKARLA
ncbi:P-loop containing nucleoside triphosphate hydrolase protein [Dichotomocladium elegans]|nr:P-loop containing nucleoside triphosphate hydrolase protein [Dichotomocladium elegans]